MRNAIHWAVHLAILEITHRVVLFGWEKYDLAIIVKIQNIRLYEATYFVRKMEYYH